MIIKKSPRVHHEAITINVLTTPSLSGGWMPETFFTIGSQLLDGDNSHGWEILAIQV